MWPLWKASVGVLSGVEDTGVDPADPVLICMDLCPWGLLGRMSGRPDRDRQLTESSEHPRFAGWRDSQGRSPDLEHKGRYITVDSLLHQCVSPINIDLVSMSSFDAIVEPTCRLLYKPLAHAETAGCHMDVYPPAKREGSAGYPVAM